MLRLRLPARAVRTERRGKEAVLSQTTNKFSKNIITVISVRPRNCRWYDVRFHPTPGMTRLLASIFEKFI